MTMTLDSTPKAERDPFLGDSDDSSISSWPKRTSCDLCGCQTTSRSRTTSLSLLKRLALSLLVLVNLSAIIVGVIFWNTSSSGCTKNQNALPEINVKTERRPYGLMHSSPYVGHDFPKADAAWDKLLDSINLRVSSTELSKQSPNTTSIELPHGGHLAWLGVFHELHCVKMLRKMNYREHYLPNMTMSQLLDHQVHVDHCIDQLREATMCRADTESLTTFAWEVGYDKPLLSPNRPLHRCTNWQALMDSLSSRVIPIDEIRMASTRSRSA